MNFLAHLYLSGTDSDLMIGNFIADHVKGSMVNNLPEKVRSGITLHRQIDEFTDHHHVVAESKKRLRSVVGKYAPVVADIYYDHFLAAEWENYSELSLDDFADSFYKLISNYQGWIPDRTRSMLRYMIPGNWLVGYARIEGIEQTLEGMSRRARFESGMEKAGDELRRNYNDYRNEFIEFFPDLVAYARKLQVTSNK